MGKRNSKNNIKSKIIGIIFVILIIFLEQIGINVQNFIGDLANVQTAEISYDISAIPEYKDKPYVIIDNNIPNFSEQDYTIKSFEKYAKLDKLGRCGVAFGNICKETMPPKGDERGEISSVRPTGWIQKKYNGEYLYNRCHLIGYQLSDEDANELNLITGTRYFNVEGMLPFENQVAYYIKENQNNHVLYRVTPIFEGNNLFVSGVQMEAYSVEDDGKGVCFNVFVYNVQPGVEIDYETGKSALKN